jgi:hypothetical protein
LIIVALKNVIALGCVALGASFLSLACSVSSADESTATDGTEEDLSAAQEFGCTVDDDCVAVSKGGCCPNGWNVAVNKHHTRYYANHNKCATPDQICPMYVILDTRVAQCSSAGKCEMVSKKDPPPPPPNGCRTTGCAKGSTCQICWANYACVPNGAVC